MTSAVEGQKQNLCGVDKEQEEEEIRKRTSDLHVTCIVQASL
jgi:hypothetical protein